MTTNTISGAPAPTATPTPQLASSDAHRLTFGRVLRSEWQKLFWLRSVTWSACLLVLLSVISGFTVGTLTTDSIPSPEFAGALIVDTASTAWVFLAVLMALIGVFAITSEYGSGMIRSTVCAVPNRNLLFGAKLLSLTLLSLLVAAVTVGATAVLTALVIDLTHLPQVLNGSVLLSLAVTVVTLVLTTLTAFAVGSLLRASSGAITLVVGILLIAPMLLAMVSAFGQEWAYEVARYLPTSLAGQAITGPLKSWGDAATAWGDTWVALGGLALWAAVTVVPAWIVHRSRAIS